MSASGPDVDEKRILEEQRVIAVKTSSEVAALLQCTDRSVRRACGQGRLRATKTGRQWLIRENDLDTYRFGKTPHGPHQPA
ncbi:helix-turn-helix domain-containing protein [Arthrobacter sp. SDTb3-6]|uniref:helix-turn-helix domain-containing protein n=1 Tax=Arthrobacter sp. SDTb3-6 TaxID=2713571 RepID=UPI003524B920